MIYKVYHLCPNVYTRTAKGQVFVRRLIKRWNIFIRAFNASEGRCRELNK